MLIHMMDHLQLRGLMMRSVKVDLFVMSIMFQLWISIVVHVLVGRE